jgi:hypothetical protein
MKYSDVVKNGWILPKKARYTLHDVYQVQLDSLFKVRPEHGTFSMKTAAAIVIHSAAHHGTECTEAVSLAHKINKNIHLEGLTPCQY